jgi:hypothetical protein
MTTETQAHGAVFFRHSRDCRLSRRATDGTKTECAL